MPEEIFPSKYRATFYNRERFVESVDISEDTEIFSQGIFASHFPAIIGYILGLDYRLPFSKIPYQSQLLNFTALPKLRIPKRVLDVGCGRGQLEAALMYLNIPFLAIDFSEDAVQLTKEICEKWSGMKRVDLDRFMIKQLQLESLGSLNMSCDTIVFSESIEHIPAEEFDEALGYFRSWHSRLIIANGLEFHPIIADKTGWNHIRSIDDEVYDRIASYGTIIYRNKSHLVVQL